jgi:phage baseplate assembly protein W
MDVAFPYFVNARGRTGTADDDEHVRDLIEQVLFTSSGERLNRPTFGSGLMRLVFDPNREELATATQLLVQGSLQQWLGELIQVEDTTVEIQDSALHVTVAYRLARNQERRAAEFSREVP